VKSTGGGRGGGRSSEIAWGDWASISPLNEAFFGGEDELRNLKDSGEKAEEDEAQKVRGDCLKRGRSKQGLPGQVFGNHGKATKIKPINTTGVKNHIGKGAS